MLKITPEIEKKMMDYIKGLTGAEAVFVILSEVPVPCPEEGNGEKCDGHMTGGFSIGIKNEYLPSMLETHKRYLDEELETKKDMDAEVDAELAKLKGAPIQKNAEGEDFINLKDLE